MAPRRIYNQSFGGNNNGRVVTIGGAGGLNERFSQLDNSSKALGSGQGSVFNRIQPSSSRRQASSVSNRLNRPASGGIRKRTSGGPTPMTGVQFTNRRGAQRATNGRNQRLSKTINKTTRGDTGRRGGASSQRPSGKSNARKAANAKSGKGRGGDKKKQKPVTAEELDKSLDDYMMKDPKTAQSRLDAELNNYMDEANDVLMDLQ